MQGKVWLRTEKRLRKQLFKLRDEYGACALKVSTEDAAMSFEEIREIHRLFSDILPIMAKSTSPTPAEFCLLKFILKKKQTTKKNERPDNHHPIEE